ncbi:MAG: PspC domain-containing protein [Bryobacteraceae bacterium]
MFCTSCGTELTASSRFCSQCGQGTGVTTGSDRGYYAPRRLCRLTYDKQVAGICSGLAKYLDVDVTLVRLIVLAAVILTGVVPGVIAYLLAMLIVPKDQGIFRPAQIAPPAPASSQQA